MLGATVNTTSVAMTGCICHEMRRKQNEFSTHEHIETEGSRGVFMSWCAVGVWFSLTANGAFMFHAEFGARCCKLVWKYLFLTGCFVQSCCKELADISYCLRPRLPLPLSLYFIEIFVMIWDYRVFVALENEDQGSWDLLFKKKIITGLCIYRAK